MWITAGEKANASDNNTDVIKVWANNNIEEIEVVETVEETREKTTDIIVLSTELTEAFKSKEEQEYLYKLKAEFWWDLDKLDSLQSDIVWRKLDIVKQMLDDSWYDISKIEFILGSDTVEKMNLVKEKVKAVKQWTLTLDEEYESEKSKSKDLSWIDRVFWRNIAKKIFALSKWFFWGLKEEIKDLTENILKTKDNLIILDWIRTDIEQIIKDVLDSKNQINKNYKEYYQNFIAISFIIEELKQLKLERENDLKGETSNDMKKREIERDIKKIENRLERLETFKTLVSLYVHQEQNIAYELELIADNIELEYKEASDVVSMTLISLLAQQPIKDWIDMWNLLQDLKNSAIQSYIGSTNGLRDDMVKLHTSTRNTKKVLIDAINSTRENIEKNRKEIQWLSWENQKLNSDMQSQMKKLDMLNRS